MWTAFALFALIGIGAASIVYFVLHVRRHRAPWTPARHRTRRRVALTLMVVETAALIVGNQLAQSWTTLDASVWINAPAHLFLAPTLVPYMLWENAPYVEFDRWKAAVALSVPACSYLYAWLIIGTRRPARRADAAALDAPPTPEGSAI